MTFQPGQPRPPNSGRVKGQSNKLTDEVRKLAAKHTADAIQRLAEIMSQTEDLRAAALAANSILDRSSGKPTQQMGIDPTNNSIKIVLSGDDAKL